MMKQLTPEEILSGYFYKAVISGDKYYFYKERRNQMEKCIRCGRECMSTRNKEEDVWVKTTDGLMCAQCFLKENEAYWKGYRDGRLSVRSKIGDKLSSVVEKIDALEETIPKVVKEWGVWLKHKAFNGKHKK